MKIRDAVMGGLILTVVAAVAVAAPQKYKSVEDANKDFTEDDNAPVKEERLETPRFHAFYVYTDDKSQQNHYSPSGWMGDTSDIKFSGAFKNNSKLGKGKSCLKITYLAQGKKEWAGIFWQNPANNWGNSSGGYNLSGAQWLTFWARGERGGEKISEVKIGGLTGKNPDSDTAWVSAVKLKRDWQQYKIDLRDKDLRYIAGGFCIILLKSDNPGGCTIYLDEIRYE